MDGGDFVSAVHYAVFERHACDALNVFVGDDLKMHYFIFNFIFKNNLDTLTNAGDGLMLESGIFALRILTNQHDVDVLEMSAIITNVVV